MRWKIKEFIYEMEQDAERRVFFVEGTRDQVFWSKTLGLVRRDGTVIYAIASLECDASVGGERGRLLWAAQQLSNTSIAARLQFFADADFDRVLRVQLPQNVLLTDGRDLESYVFLGDCSSHICSSVQPAAPNAHDVFQSLVITLARPLGILRIADARYGWHLPFRRTLERGIGRFVSRNDAAFALDVDALIRVLLQNDHRSLSDLSIMRDLFEVEKRTQADTTVEQIVHGKDLARLIAWNFNISQSFAEALIMLALATEISLIQRAPNIERAAIWLN